MNLSKAHKIILSSSLSVFMVGCTSAPNYSQSEMHVTVEEVSSQQQIKPKKIPSLVKSSPTVPTLSNLKESDTFDVVVTSVPVRDLLFVLARDAGVNMDVDDEVGGLVSISALDQTLDAILARIAEQVDIRIEYVGDAIVIKPDSPYFKQYFVDYLAVSRTFSSNLSSAGVGSGEVSVTSTGTSDFWLNLELAVGAILGVAPASTGGDNASVANISGLDDETLAAKEAAQEVVISEIKHGEETFFSINPDQGILVVHAPQNLQKEVEAYLENISVIAKRQVLLEATVVEVVLNNQYAQGIDWSLFNSLASEGLGLYQGGVPGAPAAAVNYLTRAFSTTFTALNGNSNQFATFGEAAKAAEAAIAGYETDEFTSIISSEYEVSEVDVNGVTMYVAEVDLDLETLNEQSTSRNAGGLAPNFAQDGFFTAAFRQGDLGVAVSLLDRFGDSKVLSSPRISALNNQPALLKVVDEEVYFNFTVNDTINEETGQVTGRTVDVEENVVDVGFVLNMVPNISANGEIMLNLKPTVTRVIDYRKVPALPTVGQSEASSSQNYVPITRVREIESLISLRDGEVAVLGGLLEDRVSDNNTGVPGLSSLPGVGALFENKNQSTFKTEFVVFLRAKIINNPSLNGDYSTYRDLLPDSDFIIRDTGDSIFVPDQKVGR